MNTGPTPLAILAEFDGNRWLVHCDKFPEEHFHGRTFAEALGKLVWFNREALNIDAKAYGLGGLRAFPHVSKATEGELLHMRENIADGRQRNARRITKDGN